jgi:threonine synthase
VLGGLAPDGGLYVPEGWPALSGDYFPRCVNASYAAVAAEVLQLFAGNDLSEAEAWGLARRAYDVDLGEQPASRFTHAAIAPLTQLGGGAWLLELFHGPSLSFKDVAMQLIAPLYEHILEKRGGRLTIVCATSGDTGGAAVEAFKNAERVDLIVLIPRGRVSEVQQRFMTTSGAPNVHCALVDGDFDACQALLKALFADQDFAARAKLSAVNSINWTRILAQSVYFVMTSSVLARLPEVEAVSFVAPTGNFGDAFSAFAAAKIGAPVGGILAATNQNDILYRGYVSDEYVRQPTIATLSPAMDIQAPSNFERYVFERTGRDGARVSRLYRQFAETGAFTIDLGPSNQPLIAAEAASDDMTLAAMRKHYERTGAAICPHTAVGMAAAALHDRALAAPTVFLATAHPAKFPETVEKAIGVAPPLPRRCGDLYARPEQTVSMDNDAAALKTFIAERSRAWS